MASVDKFRIVLSARGGHGAKPQETADPIVCAAHVVTALQTLVSRERDPLAPAVLTVGTIHGGTAVNIIPKEVELTGTVRVYDPALRALLPARMERVCEGVATALDCGCDVTYTHMYPPTVNDEGLAALVGEVAKDVVGESGCGKLVQGMWSEDFAYFGENVPSCFFFVGGRNEDKGLTYPHHSDRFDFDEDALPIGVEMFRQVALRFLHATREG